MLGLSCDEGNSLCHLAIVSKAFSPHDHDPKSLEDSHSFPNVIETKTGFHLKNDKSSMKEEDEDTVHSRTLFSFLFLSCFTFSLNPSLLSWTGYEE